MPNYIYEMVEGPDYPTLKKKQRALALITAKAHLRRTSLDVTEVVCTHGCDASEEDVETSVLAETGYKTPWIRYSLDEFAAKLHSDLPTFHEEVQPDAPPAQPSPPAPPAQPDEITEAHAFLTARFDEVKQAAPRGRGRPKGPIVCAACKKKFLSSDAKYNHVRRGKYVPV
jgi:hypothetical protein